MDPDNSKLQERAKEVKALRDADKATVPFSLKTDTETNPFLRPDDAGIRSTLSLSAGASDVDAFATIRKSKDNF